MGDNTAIEWTDATWNPITGCTRVDEGCRNCYAEIMAARFSKPGQWGHGLAKPVQVGGKTDHRWTGQTRLDAHKLDAPLRWKKPRRIFVCSTADLFHENNPDDWIDQVFAIMALASNHTFQVLTKRPERARDYFRENTAWRSRIAALLNDLKPSTLWTGNVYQGWQTLHGSPNGLSNVWLGVSVSDQASADLRIPHLLATPAAVRFISAEPLLGPVDLSHWMGVHHSRDNNLSDPETRRAIEYMIRLARAQFRAEHGNHGIDWTIIGGESGPGARPMQDEWAQTIVDQCKAAGVAVFMKQMGGTRKPFRPIPASLMVREWPNE